MSSFHWAHFVVLCSWGFLVVGEIILELWGRRDPSRYSSVADIHRWIDLRLEVPLLMGVLLTGGALLTQTPLDGELMLKIAAGLGAVMVNVACVSVVLRRSAEAAKDPASAKVESLTRRVFHTVYIGVPLGFIALGIGAHRLGWF